MSRQVDVEVAYSGKDQNQFQTVEHWLPSWLKSLPDARTAHVTIKEGKPNLEYRLRVSGERGIGSKEFTLGVDDIGPTDAKGYTISNKKYQMGGPIPSSVFTITYQ